MSTTKLYLDYTNKTFTVVGCFYGYIKDDCVYVMCDWGMEEIPIKYIFDCNHFVASDPDRVYSNVMHANETYMYRSVDNRFYPDFLFENLEDKINFIQFINAV